MKYSLKASRAEALQRCKSNVYNTRLDYSFIDIILSEFQRVNLSYVRQHNIKYQIYSKLVSVHIEFFGRKVLVY